MYYTATESPKGSVNNVKVTCLSCGTGNLFVNPNLVTSHGGMWKCPVCAHINGRG